MAEAAQAAQAAAEAAETIQIEQAEAQAQAATEARGESTSLLNDPNSRYYEREEV